MPRNRHAWRLLLMLALLQPLLAACALPSSGVSDARFARLTRGVNLSHWFSQDQLTPTRFQYFYPPSELARIRELGFLHVRLPLDPALIFRPDQPAQLDAVNLAHVDRAIETILASGLAVIVDIHPQESFVARLKGDDAFVAAFATFWESLARHLSRRDPEWVFLEAMNESHIENAARWEAIQRQLLAAMRRGAPAHTLIASGDDFSSIDRLVELTPVDDRNVVYNFHFYEPHTFTHQGATWGWSMWRNFRDLPYPSSPDAIDAIIDRIRVRAALEHVRHYGEERWGPERIEQRIQLAVAWAKRHNVRLTANEFGVYRRSAPPADRNRWISDVRTSFERNQIGWTMWDYSEGFGVGERSGGSVVIDRATLAALGLGS